MKAHTVAPDFYYLSAAELQHGTPIYKREKLNALHLRAGDFMQPLNLKRRSNEAPAIQASAQFEQPLFRRLARFMALSLSSETC